MRFIGVSILFLVALYSTDRAFADDRPRVEIAPELILERFSVNKGGDILLVPVKFAGKDRLFAVDTGMTITSIDQNLPLGEPFDVVTVETPQGDVLVKTYRGPDVSVGQLPLRVSEVMGIDMKPFRESNGYPIEGILGMDFLGRQIVHVDFDRGELLLLAAAPTNSGDALPIYRNSNGIPELEALVSKDQKIRFQIDTGCSGHDSGSIQILPMRKLVGSGDFQEVGSLVGDTLSGSHVYPIFQGKRVWLGGFAVERPIFAESPAGSRFGLNFCSRFVMTFDFPKGQVYLKKGQDYGRADLRNRSGVHMLRRGKDVVIDRVDQLSPGSFAGVRVGDILLSLGASRTDQTSLFELRKVLGKEGPVACSVRRGSQNQELTLKLSR